MQATSSITAVFLHCLFGIALGSWAVDSDQPGVLVTHIEDGDINSHPWRVRRQTPRNGFTPEERKELLDRHNELRATRGASDMMRMDWDSELEKSAQAWANQCSFTHSTSRSTIPGYSYAGENLYAGQASVDPGSVVQMWFDEWPDYNYDSLFCVPGKMCGHYTQVVWSTSRALGCGVQFCPYLDRVTFRNAYNVVCQYGPGGNIIGYKPFKKGRACSECPQDAQFCTDGLCYHTQEVEGNNGNGGNTSTQLSASLWTLVAAVLYSLNTLLKTRMS